MFEKAKSIDFDYVDILERLSGSIGIGIALLALIIIFTIAVPKFATPSNISSIFNQITINMVVALGMTFVMIAAGIDLSVGAQMAFAALVCGKILQSGILPPIPLLILALVVALFNGVFWGFVNGIIIESWGISSFIVTLGMLSVIRGSGLVMSQAATIYNFPRAILSLAGVQFFGFIPLMLIVTLFLAAVSYFAINKTVFGRHVIATGDEREAARAAGISTKKIRITVFTISGFMSAVGGIMLLSRLSIAQATLASGAELRAIAAVIIGGTSLSGGKGSIIGTIFGATILGVLDNGLVIIGLSDFVREIFTGGLIVLAVGLDALRRRLTEEVD